MKSKKSSKKIKFNSVDPVATSRAVIALLIILLAASVFILFKTYQDNIIMNNMFFPFMLLTFIGMGLLVSLLFLINPQKKRK